MSSLKKQGIEKPLLIFTIFFLLIDLCLVRFPEPGFTAKIVYYFLGWIDLLGQLLATIVSPLVGNVSSYGGWHLYMFFNIVTHLIGSIIIILYLNRNDQSADWNSFSGSDDSPSIESRREYSGRDSDKLNNPSRRSSFTPEKCPDCQGTRKCRKCHGTGDNINVFDNAAKGMFNSDPESCHECNGSGECQTCHGTGNI